MSTSAPGAAVTGDAQPAGAVLSDYGGAMSAVAWPAAVPARAVAGYAMPAIPEPLTLSGADTVSATDAAVPASGSVGTCRHCGLALFCDGPGPGTAASAEADQNDFYDESWAPFRDYQLVDSSGTIRCYGASAQSEPGVAIGQVPHHELA